MRDEAAAGGIEAAEGVAGMTRVWIAGDRMATVMFNALSLMFPPGERFFVESLAKFRGTLPADLERRVDGFSRQETAHARAHAVLNARIRETGYETTMLASRIGARLLAGRFLPKHLRAGITAAMEHFTAILSREILRDPSHLSGCPAEIRRLWLWHATEEIEHRSVAFDVFRASIAHLGGFQRYALRCRLMVAATRIFVGSVCGTMIAFLGQDGATPAAARTATLRFLFLRPGIGRRVLGAYLMYFLPGFHPDRMRCEAIAPEGGADAAERADS